MGLWNPFGMGINFRKQNSNWYGYLSLGGRCQYQNLPKIKEDPHRVCIENVNPPPHPLSNGKFYWQLILCMIMAKKLLMKFINQENTLINHNNNSFKLNVFLLLINFYFNFKHLKYSKFTFSSRLLS